MKSKRFLSAIAVLLLLTALLSSCSFNYKKKNLDKYISVDESLYLGVPVDLDGEDYEITEKELEEAIFAIRLSARQALAKAATTTHIALGHDVYINYWGEYRHKKNGHMIQFSGGSNITVSTPTTLTIGSGNFIDGFEDGLIGYAPNKTTFSHTDEKGRVLSPDSVVFINIEYQYDDGENNITSGRYDNLRVDLADPGILGAAFAEKLSTLKTGDSFDFGYTENWETGRIPLDWDGDGVNEYIAVKGKISSLVKSERTIEVHATFPDDYSEESLQGVEAVFHVVVAYTDVYELPVLEKSLIEKAYPDFKAEGEDYIGEFRAYLQNELEKQAEESRQNDIQNAVWEYLLENAGFTGKLPKKAFKENAEEIYADMLAEFAYYDDLMYQQYQYHYPDFETFAVSFYETDDMTWQEYRDEQAEKLTKEELLLYAIARDAGWLLTDAEFTAEKNRIVAEYAEEYDMAQSQILEMLGEDAIYDTILYEKVIAKVAEAANVTEI